MTGARPSARACGFGLEKGKHSAEKSQKVIFLPPLDELERRPPRRPSSCRQPAFVGYTRGFSLDRTHVFARHPSTRDNGSSLFGHGFSQDCSADTRNVLQGA